MMTEMKEIYIRERRALIAKDFRHLNDMQQKAVMATEGPLLVLAGAGSGKTTVLIHRIANLLKYGCASDSSELPAGAQESDIALFRAGGAEAERKAALSPVDPWRILAITFTNKAAGELKERLGRMLGEKADDIWACTFHSACVRILRRDAERLGFPTSFTIYDTADSLSVVKSILKEMDLDEKSFPPKAMLAQISRAKDEELRTDRCLAEAKATGDIRRIRFAELYCEYSRRLHAAGAMDFDDLIACTVRLLQENDDVREYWQRRFRYVLVDEYQDTNHLQYLLTTLLSGGSGNLCVVGDDDQSIYKFRGATIENILSFESQYPNCRTIRLEQNYRSTGHILSAANSVIRNNRSRKGKELWTNHDGGDKVKLYVADNEHEEAQYVASEILAGYSHGGNWRDHAVLYRMNAQSNQLEYAFKRNSIPYRVIGGMRFFDRAEVKDVLAYLCLIASPTDDLRFRRIVNVPVRGIGERSIDVLQECARQDGCSLLEAAGRAGSYGVLARSASKLESFAKMMQELRAFSLENPPDVLLDELLARTGYLRLLEEKNTVEDKSRAENVRELKTVILGYMQESGDTTLEGFLANVALYTDLDSSDDDDCVVMMTMHSAKGLEFPKVFVVGMEETLFPSIRAIGEDAEMEEERRLCYVAITRAQQELHLVCARQRMIFGRTTSNRVSRFVTEIDPDVIDGRIPRGFSTREKPAAPAYSAYTNTKPKLGFAAPGAAQKTAAPSPSFVLGDNVRHKAFGEGVIVKMSPMGGDYLIEVQFQTAGSKKLMLRAAAMFMTKIE